MTIKEFQRLNAYSYAHHFRPRPSRPIVSRFLAKNSGKKAQGRELVPLERVFNHPSFVR